MDTKDEFLRILIVDDNDEDIETMQYILEDYIPDVKIVGTAQNYNDAIKLINTTDFDLLLLDIELDLGHTGFDVLEAMQQPTKHVVFISARDKYLQQAVRSIVVDYIFKPINIEALKNAIESVRTKISKNNEENLQQQHKDDDETIRLSRLEIPSTEGIYYINMDNIIQIQASGSYSEIKLIDGTNILSSRRIGDLEPLLCKKKFFRVQQSHIINLTFVKMINKNEGFVKLENNNIAKISREKKGILTEMLRSL